MSEQSHSHLAHAKECSVGLRKYTERAAGYGCLAVMPVLPGDESYFPDRGILLPFTPAHRQRIMYAHREPEYHEFIGLCEKIWVCQKTGRLEIDRIYPGMYGGEYHPLNVGHLCPLCNKARISYPQWGWIDYRYFYPEFMRAMEAYHNAQHRQLEFFFESARVTPAVPHWAPYRRGIRPGKHF
jgi:hypothetical protein